jgi:putative nucleotidyltransferase with HDIG domain
VEQRPSFPADVESALARLLGAGVRVHVVGGALRDTLLGREARDFDFVVESQLEAAQRALPEAIAIFAHTPVLVIPVAHRGSRVEITVLRAGARSLEEDLRRRDFTLNAIAFDPRAGTYVDPLDGRGDLAARRLRAADPRCAFRDDAIRILRGIRLSIELELEIDPETAAAMEREAWRLHEAPGERRRDELLRLLGLSPPSRGIELLRAVGALAPLLPELLRGVGIAQNRYHREDVFRHTLRVCDTVRPDPLLRLAALLHDVAKPESKSFTSKAKDFAFTRHELLGVAHVRRVAERLRLSKRLQSRLERLVRHHLLLPERLKTDAAIRRMLRRTGRDILPDLLELRRADLASRDPHGRTPGDWEAIERRIRELERTASAASPVALAIGGREIMQELGIPEGPEVGRWLRRVARRVLDRPAENERERLLAWLREARKAEAE